MKKIIFAALIAIASHGAWAASSGIVDKVFVPSGTGAVSRAYAAKFREIRTVNDFGAVGNGIADDTAAFTKAFAANGVAYLPKGYTYKVQALTVGAGQSIIGPGTMKGFTATTMATLSGADASVKDIKVDANGAKYAFVLTGARTTVRGVRFGGDVGHYVYSGGADGVQVKNNTFDGSSAVNITTPVVIETGTNYSVFGNTFIDTIGFGIQSRNSSYGGQIARNKFRQPIYTHSITATASQTVFNFTLSKAVQRFGVQVNGVPTTTGVTITTSNNTNFVATFAVGKSAGVVVKMLGFRALENVNVNSKVYDLAVIGNDSDGTGDSGIVIGADYHNGLLDPNNVVDADLPARITVRNNKVKNSAYSGIAQTHTAADCIIDGNDVQNSGLITESLSYSSGIFISGPNASVRGNLLSNTTTPTTMRYGIVVGGQMVSDGSAQAAQRIGGNSFVGTFTNKVFITNQTAGFRKQSIMIEGGTETGYPANIDTDTRFTNKPANTPYFTYANAGAGWGYSTAVKLGGTASLLTIAGAYVDVSLPALAALDGQILRIDFMAKAVSGSSYVHVYSSLSGGTTAVGLNITDTSWRHYTFYFPLTPGVDVTSVFLRIGGDTGGANIQNIRMVGVAVP